uniref:Reverse transcriptase-rnase h-integrase n=2 Tax=Moniliophthora roreri TaxID=221103 RepID=A0A0W0GFT2_MONRR
MPPPESPHLLPPPTPEVFKHLKLLFHPEAEVMPAVGGEVLTERYEDSENRTPSNDEGLPTMSLRPLTPLPTPMTLLVDHVSALCADWNAISPKIAHNTCVTNASRLSLSIRLDIRLDTALTNEGLATLHVEGLVRVQTLCRMITIMTMNLMTISEESAEELIHNSGGDVDFLFVGADPRKVERFEGLLLVEEWTATGWQLTSDVLATPML